MCDTVVVVGERAILFGKNSDRDPNEEQRLEWHPRRTGGERLRCTWVGIPEAPRTHATLLSRPYWMWGAEMGANEHGVVIGNEAVFTRRKREPVGLLGMDLVRLGLERGESAEEAVSVIVALLKRHGQGGRAGYDDASFAYDNAFLVADPRCAFVLETAGRDAAVEEVKRGARAISNALTLRAFRADRDLLRGMVARARTRRACLEAGSRDAERPEHIAVALRSHGRSRDPVYAPLNGAMSAPCMHAGGLVANSQTVASWISELSSEGAKHFATGTAAPCLAGFKPVEHACSVEASWWDFETFHRSIIGDTQAAAEYRQARDEWERATWSGERRPNAAFREWDEFLSWASRRFVDGKDTRPWFARRYWAARARDRNRAVPKLPAWR
jgi:hypothetical protein